MNRQLIEETYEMRKLNISEKIKSFDCGDTDLNDFILNESFLYIKIIATFVPINRI